MSAAIYNLSLSTISSFSYYHLQFLKKLTFIIHYVLYGFSSINDIKVYAQCFACQHEVATFHDPGNTVPFILSHALHSSLIRRGESAKLLGLRAFNSQTDSFTCSTKCKLHRAILGNDAIFLWHFRWPNCCVTDERREQWEHVNLTEDQTAIAPDNRSLSKGHT